MFVASSDWGAGCLFVIGCFVNTLLLFLCWIPPILHLRVKIIVGIAYCLMPLSFFLDWERLLLEITAALGQGNQLAGVSASEWVSALRFLAEGGFIVLALVVLVGVALDVSRRHHNWDVDDAEDGEESRWT